MSSSDHDLSDLLGAYALDAVEADDARRIEDHLATCPKCRSEVQTYRETAAMLAYAGADAPDGVWARIDAEIGAGEARLPSSISTIGAVTTEGTERRRGLRGVLVGVAALAAAAIAVLGIEVGNLDGRVNSIQSASRSGLAPLVVSALEAPHSNVMLSQAGSAASASVAITRDGSAFWLGSTLATLPSDRTYQVWGSVHGRIVSLGVLGSAPGRLAMFRVQKGTARLMVSNEPKGGSAAPTTHVLVAGDVPTSI